MANTKIALAAATAACNSIVDTLDNGAAAGTIKVFGGTQPTGGPGISPSTATLLVQATLSDPAFGNAVDAAPGGKATANAIAAVSIGTSGTAAWFRALDSNGVAYIDGDITTTGGGGDMEANSVNLTAGSNFDVTSWVITMPES